MRLAELSWPDVPDRSVLVVPLGSCEQHGPHLPLDTDTRIAVALAGALADGDPAGLLLGPTIGVGASGEHESFPGTLSIGTVVLEAVLVELIRSALPPPGSERACPFRGVVVVNGHGGNVEATSRAAALLADEDRDVLVWHPEVRGGDSHAGVTETSLLLHLCPDAVDLSRAEVGSTARWRDIGDAVRTGGLAAVTANGVLGDPTGATAEAGRQTFETLVGRLRDEVDRWRDTLER